MRVVWITGLSGSGKSTIAKALLEKLQEEGLSSVNIDGDSLRKRLPVGFSIDQRWKNVWRAIYEAKVATIYHDVVVVTLISPLIEMRQKARKNITSFLYPTRRFIEVYMNTPLETCEKRDPKGLYKRVRAGEIKSFTGIDSPYEPPVNPEIIVNQESSVEMTVKTIYDYLNEN